MSEQIVHLNEQVIKTEVKELVQVVNDDFRAPNLNQDFFCDFPWSSDARAKPALW